MFMFVYVYHRIHTGLTYIHNLQKYSPDFYPVTDFFSLYANDAISFAKATNQIESQKQMRNEKKSIKEPELIKLLD